MCFRSRCVNKSAVYEKSICAIRLCNSDFINYYNILIFLKYETFIKVEYKILFSLSPTLSGFCFFHC